MATDLPAVILLGGDTPIGLTVTRELGERGVAVHVVARARDGAALHSRWASSRHVRPRDEEALIAFLNEIARASGAELLMAVSEIDLLTVRAAADTGRLKVKVLVPKLEALRRVNDKMSTYETATAVGIPVPRTWQPESDSADDIPDLAFPVILKWRDPARISGALARAGLELVKSEHCRDRVALARALARYRPVGGYPMVQEYCAGGGLGHMIYLDRGEAILKFQHIRRSEWPPAGGSSTVCESLPLTFHGEWIERSIELLRRIEWQGAAMVEYRYDAARDRLALMEINGRFWGSLPLAYHAGAHFAWTTYSVEGLGNRPTVTPYRPGVVCRYMIPETRRVLTLLFRPGAIDDPAFERRPWRAVAQYILAFFRPGTRYFVFSFRDPMPFLFDIAYVLRKMLRLPVN